MEAAFQYVNEFHENVLGFCNNIYNAEGGTHLTGFKTTFTTVMNQYAREIGILKEKDTNFTGADIRNGMTAIISIKHPDPRFEGQTKTKTGQSRRGIAIAAMVSVFIHFPSFHSPIIQKRLSLMQQPLLILFKHYFLFISSVLIITPVCFH